MRVLKLIALATLLALGACAPQQSRESRIDAFCSSDRDGASQCRQYYARELAVDPPAVAAPTSGPGTRSALIGALIANQPHPYVGQSYQMPVYQPVRLQTTCMRMGNMLSCN